MVQQLVLPIKDSNILKMVQDTLLDSFRAGRRNYTIFQVGKATLLRVSDVMKLKKTDVFNLDGTVKQTAFIHDQKTGKGNTLYLKVLQSKYQVTADVENRTLNFNEVKKELDAGQIIQMDVYDQNETLPQGSEGNEGHALAIVGYILPADGDTAKHAPYYEVWNPWWGNTFYVSSKSPYFNLAGTQYKWARTWHNWRKVTTSATTKTAPVIAQQKVASAPNPEAIKVKTLPQLSPKVQLYNPKTPNPTDYLFQDCPLPIRSNLNNFASQMGNNIRTYTTTHGVRYGISLRDDKNYMNAWRNKYTKKGTYNLSAQRFRSTIIDLIDFNSAIAKWGLSTCVIMAIIAIAQAIPVVDAIVDSVVAIVGLAIGGGIDIAAVYELCDNVIRLVDAQMKIEGQFNAIPG